MAGVAPAAFGVLRDDAAIAWVYRVDAGFRKPTTAGAYPGSSITGMRRDEAVASLTQHEPFIAPLHSYTCMLLAGAPLLDATRHAT
jgi:hypothetical protein